MTANLISRPDPDARPPAPGAAEAANTAEVVTAAMAKTYFVKTWGCQMNVFDSDRMGDLLQGLGYRQAKEAQAADLVILNTCHIREKATEKLFSELGRLREVQEARGQEGRRLVLAVAGCVAQAQGEEIQNRAPFVDLVFGPQTYHRLGKMLAQVEQGGQVVDTDFPAVSKFDFLPEETARQGVSAYLSIQEGCDKFCTFCVVPYTRGNEYSRPVAEVVTHARRLLALGARELVLLGQNVNAYHGVDARGQPSNLGRLLFELASLEGLVRLRYTTSHPRDVDADLVRAHKEITALIPHLHLPVQSGSDRMLAAMNRRHSQDDYLRVIDRLRSARPDLVFTSDFIVGFPGESDADFAQTLALVDRVGFVGGYSFLFSPRPGTPAAQREPAVPQAVKEERLAALQDRLSARQRRFHQASVGEVLPVLFDGPGRNPGQVRGRTCYYQPIHAIGGPALVAKQVSVKVCEARQNSLRGEVCPCP